jgi:hypothetical protein
LFEGDDKEDELFRTPLTGKCVLYRMANFAVALFSNFVYASNAIEAWCLLAFIFIFSPPQYLVMVYM